MTQGTFAPDEYESEPRREYGMWWGIVTDNRDPEGRGRVRASIPGITNGSSNWAEAVGNPGQGGQKHGSFATPKIGANVLIAFIQGDIDEPVYWGGPPPIGEVSDGAERPNNVVIAETDNFRVVILEDPGATRLRIETRLPGKTAEQIAAAQSYIDMTITGGGSGKAHAIEVHAASALRLTSRGAVVIDAPVVNIKGRAVGPRSGDI